MGIKNTAGLSIALASLVVTALACSGSDSPGPGGNAADGGPLATNDSGAGANDGGGGSPDSSTRAPTVDAACGAYATAICAKIQSCGTLAIAALYGDLPTCEARYKLDCTTAAGAPGQAATGASLGECATSVASLTCAQIVSRDSGPKCRVPGTLQDGAPCGYNSQCQSTFCAVAPDKSCGTCAPVTKENDACVNKACSPGTLCGDDDTKCHAPIAGKVGDACNRFYDCDVANGSGCNTVGKKCIAVELSTDGKCGADNLIAPTKFTACPANGNCSALFNGNCGKVANEGASCSDKGDNCLPSAHCVGGKCELQSTTCQ